MTKTEVVELFKFIAAVYPQFEVTQLKLNVWSGLLADQNPASVMRNAERHAMQNKFPPNPSELREIRLESNTNTFLERMDKWEREAVGNQH